METIRKDKGTWQVRERHGGRYFTVTLEARNKSEAERIGREMLSRREQEEDARSKRGAEEEHTFGHYADGYLSRAETIVKGSTLGNKERFVRKYFLKFFGEKRTTAGRVTAKTAEEYREWVHSLGFGSSNSNHIMTESRDFISYLITQEAIDPYDGQRAIGVLTSFRKEERPDEDGVGGNFLTKEEFDKFLSVFPEDDPFRYFFYFSFWCATRIGETLGLKFSDFDLASHSMSVRRQYSKEGLVTTPKTSSSTATVTLPPKVLETLGRYKTLIMAQDGDWLFFPEKHLSRTTAERRLAEGLDKAGVHRITIHGFRHSMASYLLSQGFSYLYVSRYLRHKSPEVTLQVYAHWIKTDEEDRIDRLG